MKKKIIGICISIMLVIVTLPVIGAGNHGIREAITIKGKGSNADPEITDDEGDIFGTLIIFPVLLELLASLRLLDIENFDSLDILSAWFYENPDKPEYLYTAIKLKNLEFVEPRTIYAIHWWHNGQKHFAAYVHTHSQGAYIQFASCRVIGRRTFSSSIEGAFDFEKEIVTFMIPKSLIGNPQPGDKLTDTYAWTGLRFKIDLLTVFLGGELAKDYAGPGKDYIIQY